VNRNGTLRVEEKGGDAVFDGLLMLEDRGEVGDGWNYRRPEKDAIHTSANVAANVSVEHDGPLVTTLRISLELQVPRSIDESGRARGNALVALPVEHRVRMTAGSSVLGVTTVVGNRATDHILKVLFPSGRDTEQFVTNTPFDLVVRSFIRPDRSDYVEPDTGVSPSQGFMCVEDRRAALAVFTCGLYEYEAYDDAPRTLALTLMRCFRKEVATHGGTDGQLQGEQRFEYAL
jgi:alpha-mannosidase